MKTFPLAVIVLMLLTSLVFEEQPLAKANFSPRATIKITSPRNDGYTTSQVQLNVTVKVMYDSPNGSLYSTLCYSLDGGENIPITSNYQGVFWSGVVPFSVTTGEAILFCHIKGGIMNDKV